METTRKKGFCIFVDTVFQGRVPVELGPDGKPFVYETERDAQNSIAENLIQRLHEFLDAERDFDDAISIEDYIEPVEVLADGTVMRDPN